ncbi:Phosphatidylinositol transfer protein beta isoform [Acipenser ruthenus]|uniref:Phosphatidylinositol transfer protein beta isoform n=1 Tax=Acipenser ruthenus TaxID=7906 RepID=A0A444V4Z0_ACIRT|nr:Phosphatidylinositol transfer protein beta isoform [Acipenser ruthenus]
MKRIFKILLCLDLAISDDTTHRDVLQGLAERFARRQASYLQSTLPGRSPGTGGGIKRLLIKHGDVRVRAAAAAEEKMVLIKEYKVPGFVKMIAPEGALVFHEKAWNAYPYCRTSRFFRTILHNEYMKDDFFIKIETWHKPDMGTVENVHELDPNTWKCVEVVPIDIADRSQVEHSDYKTDEDPALFQSVKTGRGPLGPDWKKELAGNQDCPRMCAYKLVTVKFKWWGLQNKIEHFIHKQEKRIFTNFHRQLFCWIDRWVELTMADIRRMEDETQKELEEVQNS